jgi:hypothetical protein
MKFSTIDICLTDSSIVCPFVRKTCRPKNAQKAAEGIRGTIFDLLLSTFLIGQSVTNIPNKSPKTTLIIYLPLPCESTACILHHFFLNYRTIDIEIDIFYPNHRIINRIVKFPLSHRLKNTFPELYPNNRKIGPFKYRFRLSIFQINYSIDDIDYRLSHGLRGREERC